MTEVRQTRIRWSLFARELEDILAVRELRLGQLDDRKDSRGAPLVHHEKVRRLKRSLSTTKTTSMLSPEDLERVAKALQFTDEERKRLYAALLATSIENMLFGRIPQDEALRVAEYLFPLLQEAIDKSGDDGALSPVRGGASTVVDEDDADATELDTRFEKALNALDQGMLALHLARSADRYQAQLDSARQAYEKFQTATRLLETATDLERGDEAWQFWRAEAQHGQETAATILADFGETPSGSL